VKRVGSHEVVMERLHLSRPTFYRRLHRGLVLTAKRLDELNGTSPARRQTNLQSSQVVGMRAAETEIESSARLTPRPRPSDTAPHMHDVRAEAEKNLRRLPMGLRPRLKLLTGSGR
jgi:hypothetical protein